jgi:hypothetical protein
VTGTEHPPFASLYGPWAAWTPADAAALFDGAPFPWWVAGGWALEAYGAPPRPHTDVDVAVLARDLPAVREHLRSLHLWEAYGGTLRPLLAGEALTEGREQLWVRRDAASPWLVDVLLTPTEGEEWVYRRDARVRRALASVGFVAGGVPYLRPELVLLYKAGPAATKDAADLAATAPLLTVDGLGWLRDALALAQPGHAWLDVI